MLDQEPFFERMARYNPFTANRVNDSSSAEVDVGNIHARAFERLVALAQEARDEQCGLGAVLWGEAGSGKSHLLARLARWAQQDKNACFIYLHNLQASPENLPRSLLKAVVSILTWGRLEQLADTLLFRLVNAFVREALAYDPNRIYSWETAKAAFRRMVQRLSDADPARAAFVDPGVYEVLYRFFDSAYQAHYAEGDERVAQLAVRWLAGDYLEPDEAHQLGLPRNRDPHAPVALADNQQIKQVLIALARLAWSRRQPFLLCFDQLDNLDNDQAAALARFLEALLDSAGNLLVVTAGIQASLLHWRESKVFQDSAWDRLAQFEIALQRIRVSEGQAIVAARLQRALQPFLELPAVQQHLQADPLFPLGRAWAEEFFGQKAEVRPRDVLNWAREGWRREQEALRRLGGAAWLAGWGTARAEDGTPLTLTEKQLHELIDLQVDQKLAELRAQRQAAPHTLPQDADNLAGLVYALLMQCRRCGIASIQDVERLPIPTSGARPAYDLIIRQGKQADPEIRTGILFLVTSNATTATTALRRLVREAAPPERLFLITDAREPLPLAARGKEYYQEVADRKDHVFYALELTFEQYADLDALQAVVGLGRSGDLEIPLPGGRTRKVTDQEVIESHERRQRYQGNLLLHALLLDLPTPELAESTPK
jgi:type II secretory pathway predicted ATPase ExeA